MINRKLFSSVFDKEFSLARIRFKTLMIIHLNSFRICY